MNKVAGIEFLQEQRIAVERERKELQAAIAKLPQLDAEIQAIDLLLAKHVGEKHRLNIDHSASRPPTPPPTNGELSIAKLTFRALTEAGKPLTSAQLLAYLASHGRTSVKGNTLRSTINQSKLMRSVTPGVYGLVELKTE